MEVSSSQMLLATLPDHAQNYWSWGYMEKQS